MITTDDMWSCKHCTAGIDDDGMTVPCCGKSGIPCEDVLQYGDEDCDLQGDEE
jgi:hypothetical protein